jgi:large subunit ribosomal protein L27e
LVSVILKIFYYQYETNFSSFKIGRIILILNGRHAGKKGIIVENRIQSKTLSFNSVIVLAIKSFPKKINRKKNEKSTKRKSSIKIFFKALNKNHILPTRYFVDLNEEQQSLIANMTLNLFKLKSDDESSIVLPEELKWKVENIFIDKYFSGKNKWFFKKLNF